MASIKVTSIVVMISILGLFLSDLAAAAATDFRQLCGKTSHKDVCISVIQSDLRTNLKNSPSGICTILNDKAQRLSFVTSNKIVGLLHKVTDLFIVKDLQLCSHKYFEMVSRLKALNFSVLNDQTYTELKIRLSLVAGGPSECEDSFKFNQPEPISSPLATDNKNLGDVISTTWQVLNLNHWAKLQFANDFDQLFSSLKGITLGGFS